MEFDKNSILSILEETGLDAGHVEKQRLERLIDKIKNGSLIGSLESKSSKYLEQILHTHIELMSDEFYAVLRKVDLYGINMDVCNATVSKNGSRYQIAVLDGLIKVVKLYVDLTQILPVLTKERIGKNITSEKYDGPESELFSDAVMTIMINYIETGEHIIDLNEMCGPMLKIHTGAALAGALTFLVAHELGHIMLGHLENRNSIKEINSNAVTNTKKLNIDDIEIEADTYAFNLISDDFKSLNLSSIIMLFGAFSFLETFSLSSNQTHPLSVKRMLNLANLASPYHQDEDRWYYDDIVDSELERFNRFANFRLQFSKKTAHDIILKNMSVKNAIEIVALVKANIKNDLGVLDK